MLIQLYSQRLKNKLTNFANLNIRVKAEALAQATQAAPSDTQRARLSQLKRKATKNLQANPLVLDTNCRPLG
jgi:hypothetical protein